MIKRNVPWNKTKCISKNTFFEFEETKNIPYHKIKAHSNVI
nr:MAG TPA: hypothetical protein [Caudoviricetes sp.]